MAENKTQLTNASVIEFLNSVENERKRQDSFAILETHERSHRGRCQKCGGPASSVLAITITNTPVGVKAHWFVTGFSPRKQSLTLYIMAGFDNYETLLSQLGKHKTGKSCLYINKIADINVDVLKELVKQSVAHMRETNDFG